MWHNITWEADWGLCNSRMASAFTLPVIMTLHFQRGLLALHQPMTSLTFNSSKIHRLCLCVCVCVEKQEGWESWEQFRPACTTDCMPMPHLEKFPSNSCHVVLCELHLKDSSSLDLNSTRTVNDAPLLIKLMKYVKWQALFAGSELSRGSGKSTGEASCPSNHRGPVKRDPTWMNEHGPADRGRSQCRKSTEDYCSPQSRDGTEATEANMTPVICTWFLFYNCKLLKVRMQLVNISRNGEKKSTHVYFMFRKGKYFFYWQQYVCNQNLQTVNVKKMRHKYT